MTKLYYSAGACSLAPHIVLRETESAFTLERVDTGTHLTEHGTDYYTVNPKGMVPVLELDDGSRLTEGPIICQYIADRACHEGLMPRGGTIERYRVMEWQNYITSELHKSFSPLFNPEIDAAGRAVFMKSLAKKFAWVSQQIGGKKFLTGDGFTAADAYLFTVARWAAFVKLDLSANVELQGFMQRVAERPAVLAALRAEGLSK